MITIKIVIKSLGECTKPTYQVDRSNIWKNITRYIDEKNIEYYEHILYNFPFSIIITYL